MYSERYMICRRCKARERQTATLPQDALSKEMEQHFEWSFKNSHFGKRCGTGVEYTNWETPKFTAPR